MESFNNASKSFFVNPEYHQLTKDHQTYVSQAPDPALYDQSTTAYCSYDSFASEIPMESLKSNISKSFLVNPEYHQLRKDHQTYVSLAPHYAQLTKDHQTYTLPNRTHDQNPVQPVIKSIWSDSYASLSEPLYYEPNEYKKNILVTANNEKKFTLDDPNYQVFFCVSL